jgi:hypothetical protein
MRADDNELRLGATHYMLKLERGWRLRTASRTNALIMS